MNKNRDTTKKLTNGIIDRLVRGKQVLKFGMNEKGKFFEAEGIWAISVLGFLIAIALFLK